MGTYAGPNIVTASMSYFVDAGSRKSLNTTAGGWSDLTGNRPTATFTNATFSATNVGLVYFGGTNSSHATVAQSFFSTGSRTFDVWVKRDQNASEYNIVWGFWLPYLSMYTNSKFLFSYSNVDGSGIDQKTHYSNQSFVDGRWYNVTCTIDYQIGVTTVSKMYIDGVLDSTLTWPSATTTVISPVGHVFESGTQHNLRLGGWHSSNPTTPMRGSISNFRIYERVLTDAEIQQNHAAMAPRFRPDVADRPVFHLDAANRNSFTRIQNGWTDLSNNKNALSFTGATFDSANGGVIKFDGTGGTPGSNATVAQSFFSTSSRTYDVWLKRDESVSQFNMPWSHYVPYLAFQSNNQLLFSYYTNNGTGTANGMTQQTLYSIVTFNNNVWYNVTCTIDYNIVATTATAKIYVNGSLINTQAWPAGTMTLPLTSFNNQSLYIGNWVFGMVGNTTWFKGSISNFRIYDRVLTDAEIIQSYNALKARFGY